MKKRVFFAMFVLITISLIIFIIEPSFLFQKVKKIKLPEWFYDLPESDYELYAIGISEIKKTKMEAFEQSDGRARAILSFAY